MFTRSKDDTKQTPPSQAPRPVPKDSGAPSIISAGVEITGNIVSPGEVQLDGTIHGDISCESFSLGESGHVTGRILANSVTIRGKIDGEICGMKVRLDKTAEVSGDVTHQTLSVEGGAKVSGHLIHKESPLEAAAGKANAETAEKATVNASSAAPARNGGAGGAGGTGQAQSGSGRSENSGRGEGSRTSDSGQPARAKASA